MKKLAALTIAAWMTAAAGVSHAAQEIRIGWVYAMANAPVLVADSNGYFKEEGLEAKLLSFTSGPLLKQAMVAGEIDLAYIGSPPVYHWYSRGLESKILAKVNYGQAAVMSRKDSDVMTLADLKGRKMAGVRKGSGMDVLLRGYVIGEAAGLVPDEDTQVISNAFRQHGAVARSEGGGRSIHVGTLHLPVPAAREHAGDLRHEQGGAQVPLVHHLRDARGDEGAPGRDRQCAACPQEGGRLPEPPARTPGTTSSPRRSGSTT